MSHQHVAMYIAGDIIMSDSPGEAIKKWRLIFGLTQTTIATRLGTSPSVISDYESGRRKFPGSRFVKKVCTGVDRDRPRERRLCNKPT